MSYDVLVGLRRRLGFAPAARDDDDRASGTDARIPDPAATLSPDGGEPPDDEDDAHLRDLPDGAGCTEIWEHLSERHAETGEEERPASECRADD